MAHPDIADLERRMEGAIKVLQTEFAGLDVARHALGRCADQRQLVVVDGARSVHRNVGDPAAANQVDHVP